MQLRRSCFSTAGAMLGLLTVGALAGCAAPDHADADVSDVGQVAYACALAGEAGSPGQWSSAVGDDADPEAIAASSSAALLGGVYGIALEGQPALSEAAAAYVRGLTRLDLEELEGSLDDLRAACADAGIDPAGDPSADGRRAYACDLAAAVLDEHGDVQTWGSLLEDSAWRESSAVAALGGGLTGTQLTGAEGLSASAQQIQRGTQTQDLELVQTALDEISTDCG